MALALAASIAACGKDDSPDIIGQSTIDSRITWSWTSPTEGTPVAFYIMSVDWKKSPDYTVFGIANNYHAINMIAGDQVHVKVAGMDAEGIRGPYSIWSEVYAVPGEFVGDVPERRQE